MTSGETYAACKQGASACGQPGWATGFSWWVIGGFFCREKLSVSMHSLTHALNIGTLAVWMSVAVFGSTGLMLGRVGHVPVVLDEVGIEFVQGVEIESVKVTNGVNDAANELTPIKHIELPAPPEMLVKHESEALPEVPDMAKAESKKVFQNIKPTIMPENRSATKLQRSVGSAADASSDSGESASGAVKISNTARLAAGRMPAPRYPSEARSKGQSGTVLIEFTIDASGRVSAAHIASPCPWSVLNQEALRAVKNWKFPPGDVMTYKKPIVFKLRNS